MGSAHLGIIWHLSPASLTPFLRFDISGKIKGLPGFSRDFALELERLLECKEDGLVTYDTEKGLTLNVASTLLFLNREFFKTKK